MDQHPYQFKSPLGYHREPYWGPYFSYLIYINDLPNNLTTKVRLFADDCLLYLPVKSDNDTSLLQNYLLKLE